uniref:Uncharacterized protein n=1 Tax=Cucumis sativus TaxID=3659 RepID=A0A0A0KPE3_CUCSA
MEKFYYACDLKEQQHWMLKKWHWGLRAEIAALDERRWLLNVVDDKVREADDWWMMERPLVADVGHRLRK